MKHEGLRGSRHLVHETPGEIGPALPFEEDRGLALVALEGTTLEGREFRRVHDRELIGTNVPAYITAGKNARSIVDELLYNLNLERLIRAGERRVHRRNTPGV